MRFLPLLITSVLLISSIQSVPAGVAMDIDQGVVENAKNFAMPLIVKKINSMIFPEISQDGFTVSNLLVELDSIDSQDIELTMKAAENALQFDVANIGIKMTADVSYKWFIIHCSGKLTATVQEGGASLSMTMPLSIQGLSPDRFVPAIALTPFSLNIDSKKVDIDLSGSFVADIIDFFEPLFQSLILNEITKQINKDVPEQVATEINTLFLESEGLLDIIKNLAFDFSIKEDIEVSDNQLKVYLNGTFFNSQDGENEYTQFPIADLLLADGTSNSIQAALSKYTVDSLLLVLHNAGKFSSKITYDEFPLLDSTILDPLLPGLRNTYGPSQPMDVVISTHRAPYSIFKEGSLGFNLDLDLHFYVEANETKPEASVVALNFADINVVVDLTLKNFTLKVKIDEMQIGDLSYSNSTIGDNIDTDGIQEFINMSMDIIKPVINGFLRKGIQIPHSLNDTIIIEEAVFQPKDGYVYVLFDPEFQ